jgi:hypothetical protein
MAASVLVHLVELHEVHEDAAMVRAQVAPGGMLSAAVLGSRRHARTTRTADGGAVETGCAGSTWPPRTWRA